MASSRQTAYFYLEDQVDNRVQTAQEYLEELAEDQLKDLEDLHKHPALRILFKAWQLTEVSILSLAQGARNRDDAWDSLNVANGVRLIIDVTQNAIKRKVEPDDGQNYAGDSRGSEGSSVGAGGSGGVDYATGWGGYGSRAIKRG